MRQLAVKRGETGEAEQTNVSHLASYRREKGRAKKQSINRGCLAFPKALP